MRVGIIQSHFIPWRGYFDFISSVDLFVLYDDVQYSKNGWLNRNQIKTPDGIRWLTVPIRNRALGQKIQETEIDDREDWRTRHLSLWKREYAAAPFLEDAINLLGEMGRGEDKTLSQLNIRLIKSVCRYLGIKTPLRLSSEWKLRGTKTDRLIDLLTQIQATSYLSGPSAEAYLEKDKFENAGIALEYKAYDYAPYPQIGGSFEGKVSILDLIANCGPDSRKWIKSQTPDHVVVGVS